MAKSRKKPKPSKNTQTFALYIASVVRNAMEDFHCKYLSDAQMKELNPIIRDAICTALHAAENCNNSAGAKNFVDYQVLSIPDYWEAPTLNKAYLECERYFSGGDKAGVLDIIARKGRR